MKKFRLLGSLVIASAVLASAVLPASATQASDITVTELQTIGGSHDDEFCSVAQTTDGGFVAVGNIQKIDGDFADISGGGIYGAVVVKVDDKGNRQWVRVFNGSYEDCFQSVIKTSDGGCVVAGYTNSHDGDFAGLNKGTSEGTSDQIVVKLDKNGQTQWIKDIGGDGWEYFYSIAQTSDGGYVAAGNELMTVDGDYTGHDKGANDGSVVKLDGSGNIQWIADIGASKKSGSTECHSVVQAPDGSYIAGGYSAATNGDFQGLNQGQDDAFIARIDSKGNVTKITDIGGTDIDFCVSVAATPDGGFVAVGNTHSHDGDFAGLSQNAEYSYIAKYDGSGNRQWMKIPDSSLNIALSSVIVTADGSIVTAGDGFVLKLDSGGNRQWLKSLGGSGNTQLYAVTEATGGALIVAGRSSSTDGDLPVKANNGNDAVIGKLSDLPGIPTNVSVQTGDGKAMVSFTAPAHSGGGPVTGYTVVATPADGGAAVTAAGTQSPLTVTGLKVGVIYSFTVSAANAQGRGAPSLSATATLTAASSSAVPHGSASSDTAVSAVAPVNNPKTGSENEHALPIALVFAGAAAGVLLLRFRSRKD